MTIPVQRMLMLLIPLWFAAAALGYLISDPPEKTCYEGSGSFFSRLGEAYSSFSMSSEVERVTPDEPIDLKEGWHAFHTARLIEETTGEFLSGAHAEVLIGHHVTAATILFGAFLLAYPAGVVLRNAVDMPSCPFTPSYLDFR